METIISDAVVRIAVTSAQDLSRLEVGAITALITADRVAVAIDLQAVPMLHSPELAHLVELYKALATRGVVLQLARVQPDLRKALTMTRLDQLFTLV